jgi:hypothetical protein
MKTILTETISVIKVSSFWALALPAAAILCPVLAGWEKVNALISRGPIIATRLSSSHLTSASR